MGLKKINWVGIAFGLLLVAAAFIFFYTEEEMNKFIFIIGLGVIVIVIPFIFQIIFQSRKEEEINEMFLEFSRNLAESVATGTPISKSIVNMRDKNFGALTPYIKKLANQIEIGIPLEKSLKTFAYEVNNPIISRAVNLISESERSGGEIEKILDSTARSIAEIEKLKEERKAAIANLVVQGYIVFFIFIGIMLVMEFKILPLAISAGSLSGITTGNVQIVDDVKNELNKDVLSNLFLYLLIAQGIFTGLAIGQLAEGSIKRGIKHSFILSASAFLVGIGVRLLFGS